MDPNWLYELVLKFPRKDRATLLDHICQGNPELRAGVEELLARHKDAPAEERAAELAETINHPVSRTDDLPPTRMAPTVESPGTVLGKYTLEHLLGEGGMGSVWIAKQHDPVKRRVG
jgi:hypothetical protein